MQNFQCPLLQKSCKVDDCGSSPRVGWVTGSESPTPPPPPSLCPAHTSCPRAGARLTHRCPRVEGRGWWVSSRTGHVVPTGGRLTPRVSRARDHRLRSPAGPATGAPLRALGPAAASSSGRRGPPSLARGIGGRASRMRRRLPAPRGAGGWEWQSFSPPALGCVSCKPSFLAQGKR